MSRQSTCGIESHLSLADRPDLRPCLPCTGLVNGGCHPFQPLERRDKVLSTHMSCLTSRPSLGFQHEYGSRLRQTILSTDKRIKTSDKKFRDDWLSFNGESSCYQMKIFGELNMWLFSLRFYLFWEINQIIQNCGDFLCAFMSCDKSFPSYKTKTRKNFIYLCAIGSIHAFITCTAIPDSSISYSNNNKINFIQEIKHNEDRPVPHRPSPPAPRPAAWRGPGDQCGRRPARIWAGPRCAPACRPAARPPCGTPCTAPPRTGPPSGERERGKG